jgi:hypothetical protein
MDRREQDGGLHRLGQVGVGPPLEGQLLGALVHEGGRDVHDGQRERAELLPDPATDLEAAQVRQVDVEQHQIGPLLGDDAERLGAGSRLDHLVARPA